MEFATPGAWESAKRKGRKQAGAVSPGNAALDDEREPDRESGLAE
jgi:hypothetical protein